jgi:hypothetical protein
VAFGIDQIEDEVAVESGRGRTDGHAGEEPAVLAIDVLADEPGMDAAAGPETGALPQVQARAAELEAEPFAQVAAGGLEAEPLVEGGGARPVGDGEDQLRVDDSTPGLLLLPGARVTCASTSCG